MQPDSGGGGGNSTLLFWLDHPDARFTRTIRYMIHNLLRARLGGPCVCDRRKLRHVAFRGAGVELSGCGLSCPTECL